MSNPRTPVHVAVDHMWAELRTRRLDPDRSASLRAHVRQVVDEARAARLYPEQLLAMIKESWRTAPEVRVQLTPDAAAEHLDRVVKMCIEEYYRDID